MLKKRTFFLLLVSLVPLSFILTQCFNNTPKEDQRGELYAGSESCKKCHSEVYDSYLHTAHFQTSRPASPDNIMGSFHKDSSVFEYGNGLKVVMEQRADSLYQTGYVNGKQTETEKFDITIGAVKAQTYLYWKDKQLFELPVSYFAALHNWANSPGFDLGRISFDRPIFKKCLECHSSYIKELTQQPGFEKASLVYGIDCERCHGPAANHVNYHTAYPDEKKAKYMTTYASLTRTQKMDACAVCHAGNKDIPQKSGFDFVMGDTLLKDPHSIAGNTKPTTLDVHVNQNALLVSSKCFIMSKMDCGTCHDPHTNQNRNIVMYTQKCLNCHSEAKHNFCKIAPQLGSAINNNCINCHMPQKSSKLIKLEASNGKINVPYLVRTHHIGIYPEETGKVLAFMKAQHL